MRAVDSAAFLTVTDFYCPGDVAEQLRLHCTSRKKSDVSGGQHSQAFELKQVSPVARTSSWLACNHLRLLYDSEEC